MWMSECLIVVDQKNDDRNTIGDIAAAVSDVGSVMDIDREEHVIQATLPAHELPVVSAMTGVSYVRCVFHYFQGKSPLQAA